MKGIPVALVVIILLAAGLGGLYLYKTKTNTPNLASDAPLNSESTSTGVTPLGTVNTMGIGLVPQNDSDMYGSVDFSNEGNKTKVVVTLTEAGAKNDSVPHPAHIHTGACPTPGEVKYPLTDVVNGESETILDVALSDLVKDVPLAVNIHKSAEEMATYYSCGDFPTAQ